MPNKEIEKFNIISRGRSLGSISFNTKEGLLQVTIGQDENELRWRVRFILETIALRTGKEEDFDKETLRLTGAEEYILQGLIQELALRGFSVCEQTT